MIYPLLAEIRWGNNIGSGDIKSLLINLGALVILALVVWWLLSLIPAGIIKTIATVVAVIIGAVWILNVLFSL